MKTNLRRTMASWMLAGGLMLVMSGCLCFPGQTVFFADRALESAVRAALDQPFGFLCERDLEKLHELDAEGIGVVDIRGLEYCTALTSLNLRSNQIRSISPLAGLRNLTWLDLGDNIVTNIEPLSGLYNLEYLSLYGADNDIRDWSPLAANVEAGGLGAGDVVTLGVEWTLNSDSTILPEFAPYYRVLQDANVVVVFAQADGATARR